MAAVIHDLVVEKHFVVKPEHKKYKPCGKAKHEFCCIAASGKSHSHAIKIHCQHRCGLLSVINASPIRKFNGPV